MKLYTALFASHQSSKSIAVIPFANSVDPKAENVSDEITSGLIDRLSKVPGLTVAKRDSVSKFKGQAVDPRTIGRELGVATVLMGSVRFDGENLLVDADLIDTSSGQKIWSKQYSGKTMVFASMRDDMVTQLSQALRKSN